jgi:hypothetical protein
MTYNRKFGLGIETTVERQRNLASLQLMSLPLPNSKKNWTPRDVVSHTKKDAINARATAEGGPPGSKPFLRHYRKAVSWVMEGLTDKEYKNIEATAESWNLTGPPEDVKRR